MRAWTQALDWAYLRFWFTRPLPGNRPVRTRIPGGVGAGRRNLPGYPIKKLGTLQKRGKVVDSLSGYTLGVADGSPTPTLWALVPSALGAVCPVYCLGGLGVEIVFGWASRRPAGGAVPPRR